MSQLEDAGNQSDATCPECGKELKNQHGMRIHYTQAHGGHLHTTKECEWCGDDFQKRPGAERVYCSHECRGEHRSEYGNPAAKRRVELVCHGCGDEFRVPRSNAEGKKYCSMECRTTDSKIQHRECEWCGDGYKGYSHRRFCSQDCYGRWISNEQPLEEHPRYKGEDKLSKPNYGKGWNEEKREAVRERDGNQCVVCSLTSTKHKSKFGHKLNVHHIIPARNFDDPEPRNAMDNLTTMCIPCHRKWEGIPLRPQVIA